MCYFTRLAFWSFAILLYVQSDVGWLNAQESGSEVEVRPTERIEGQSGFSQLEQLNKKNVKNLKPVWVYPLEGRTDTPDTLLFHEGFLYLNHANEVLALDPSSGALLWKYVNELANDSASPVMDQHLDTCGADGELYLVFKTGGEQSHRKISYFEDDNIWKVGSADKTRTAETARCGVSGYGEGSATLKTAGGLVFIVENGQFYAKDADTQDILYRFNLGTTTESDLITYVVDGKQYVTQVAGFADGAATTGMERSNSMGDLIVSFGAFPLHKSSP